MTTKGQPKKRVHTDAEVGALAQRLTIDWVAGDVIEAWLRRHVEEMTELVRNFGWSWADVARALDAAGITYRTDTPWSAFLLTRKAAKARNKNWEDAARKAGRILPLLPSRSAGSVHQPLPSSRNAIQPEVDNDEDLEPDTESYGEPTFRPVTAQGWAQPAVPLLVEAKTDFGQDPDEAINRLFGRRKSGSVPLPSIPQPEDD